MASPRVFVSSTFYDLRHIRADLERFVKETSFEPVLHERGAIPYGSDEGLEEYAYREVELCDILVSIVGGRFGTKSQRDERSISQNELKTALKSGKQVYIFVDKSVVNEYKTWEKNREITSVKWVSVDNPKVFEFISELYSLPNNNPITPFENASEICAFLKAQWAGLFQRLLNQATTAEQHRSIDKLSTAVATLERLVDLLAQHQQSRSDVVDSILLMEHPVFRALQNGLGIPFRICFYKLGDLEELLQAYRFEDYEDNDSDQYYQWIRVIRGPRGSHKPKTQYVMVDRRLFSDSGELKPMNPGDWHEDDLIVKTIEPSKPSSPFDDEDDDLPF